jgi:Alpha-kinase family
MLNHMLTHMASDICCNVAKTFLGKVLELPPATVSVLPEPDADITEETYPKGDTRCLIWTTFLASPLVSKDTIKVERKFCGNQDIPDNTDTLGRIIDAFQHHVVVDSQKDILLCDLQGTKYSVYICHVQF